MKLKLKKTMLVLLMTTLIPIRTPAIFATDNGLKTVTKEISKSIEKKIVKEKKTLKKKYKKDFNYRFVAEKLGYFGKTKKNKANKKLKALSSKKTENDVVLDTRQPSKELKESKPIQEEQVEELKESTPIQTEELKESETTSEPISTTEDNTTEEPLINPKTGKPYTKLQLKRLRREQAMKNIKEYYVLGKEMTPHDHNSITENEPSPLRIRNITYFASENVMDLQRTKDGKIYFKQYRFDFNTGKLIPFNKKDLLAINTRRNQIGAFHYPSDDFDINENGRDLTINRYVEYEIIGEVKK